MSSRTLFNVANDAERDLVNAGHLQRMLLPPPTLTASGWSIAHRYQPAGVVSGDYVGLQVHDDQLYFMLGDVSGKGVAASLLMAQLHAMFSTMIPMHLSLDDLMARASALLCASSLPAQYATMVAGILRPDGNVTISNAGHPPPLLIAGDRYTDVRATGAPMGMFCESRFDSTTITLKAGDTLFAFTDGLTEATNQAEEEYGSARAEVIAAKHAALEPASFLQAVLTDHATFRGKESTHDDLTLLVIRRL